MRLEVLAADVAQEALHQREVAEDHAAGRGVGTAPPHPAPDLGQVVHVVGQRLAGGPVGGRPDDVAAVGDGRVSVTVFADTHVAAPLAVRARVRIVACVGACAGARAGARAQFLDHRAQPLALALVVDARRDADAAFVRHHHEVARRRRQAGRDACALGAERILDDLHGERLAFAQHARDRLQRALAMLVHGARLDDVRDVQERRLVEPDVDERRFHARQHASDRALQDGADEPDLLRPLDADVDEHAVLDGRDPRLLGRHVDQQFCAHGGPDE